MTRDQRISVVVVFTFGVLAALAVMALAFGAGCASTPQAAPIAPTCEPQRWIEYQPEPCVGCLCRSADGPCLCAHICDGDDAGVPL